MGFDEVRESPLLRLVAVAYVLLAILLFSVSFPYLRAARAAFPDEAELARTLGIIAATITGDLVRRLARRRGPLLPALRDRRGGAAPPHRLSRPGSGSGSSRSPSSTAAAFTIVQQVTQRGISNAAWGATYNVLPSTHRAQAIAFMDGVPGQIGTVLVGVLLLLSTSLLAPEQVFWLGFLTAAVCVVVVAAVRRRYADALLRTLRSGLGEQILEGGRGLGDLLAAPDVRAALIGALRAPDAGTREMAAVLLARSPEPDARRALATALGDEAPAVRAAAACAVLEGADVDRTEADRAEACLVSLEPRRRQREGRRPRCPSTPGSATRRRPPSHRRRGPGSGGPGRGDGRDRRRDDLGGCRCAARRASATHRSAFEPRPPRRSPRAPRSTHVSSTSSAGPTG